MLGNVSRAGTRLDIGLEPETSFQPEVPLSMSTRPGRSARSAAAQATGRPAVGQSEVGHSEDRVAWCRELRKLFSPSAILDTNGDILHELVSMNGCAARTQLASEAALEEQAQGPSTEAIEEPHDLKCYPYQD
jgi:hypothetical protein